MRNLHPIPQSGRSRGTPASHGSTRPGGDASPKLQKLAPMLATLGSLPPHEEDYAFEIKWDGIRVLAIVDSGRVQLLSRNGKNITAQYPELSALAAEFPTGSIVLDGELVVMDDNARPDFGRLQKRMNLGNAHEIRRRMEEHPVTYVIFDVLQLNGSETTALPYAERRRLLDGLELVGPAWNTPPHFTVEGSALLDACRHRRLEGVIAKRLDSAYTPGTRSRAWIKIKVRPRQELVIGGWVPGEGSRSSTLGSLLVGYYDMPPEEARRHGRPQRFIYAGKVGAGFTEPMLRHLASRLRGLQRETAPFATTVPTSGAVYVEPVMIGEFEFAEWTSNNTLRQASFKGLRPDKDPTQVVRE